jgi:beta-galactosidase
MREAGILYVRIGEFAWSRLEPRPGDLKFEWLVQAMDVLGRHGLKVIVGTPTATPPRWMLDRHPDMLAVGADGHPRNFGSRRHYCFSHLGYRAEAARIVSLLIAHVGRHAALAGWQTDNEYGCHDTTYSYSEAARQGFRQWLEARYGTIEALNEAWGNVFWSMEYNEFDQVDLPNLTVTEANPAACMDFCHYSSDQVAAFNKVQYDLLKAARPDLPVLHNFMGATEFDHYELGKTLDAASWDSYPIGHLDVSDASAEVKARYMRQGEPDAQALKHDIYRAVGRGRMWVMEQQPGPVNWAAHNPDPLPGMVRLWTWEALAHGAEVVSYFRWRQFHSAQEQMHAGLLRPDSQPTPAHAEVTQVARELAAVGMLGKLDQAKVAIVYDYRSEWAWRIQPHAKGFSHYAHVRAVYAALRARGVEVDILSPQTADFSGYGLVAMPALFAWTDALRDAMARYEGHLLVGPRSGAKTGVFSLPSGLPPDLPANLLDAKVVRVDSLNLSHAIAVKGGGSVRLWRERLETRGTIEMEDVEGAPVLVSQGRVFYLAASGDDILVQRVVDLVLAAAGIATLALPAGVRCRTRAGLRVYVNYGAGAATLPRAADESGYVLGSATIPAAGVSVAKLVRGVCT